MVFDRASNWSTSKSDILLTTVPLEFGLLSNKDVLPFVPLNPDIPDENADGLDLKSLSPTVEVSLLFVWVDHGLVFEETVFEEKRFEFAPNAEDTFVPGRNDREYDPERCLAPKGLCRGGGGGNSPKNSLCALSKIESLLLNDDDNAFTACCSKDVLNGESLFCEEEKYILELFLLYSFRDTWFCVKGEDLTNVDFWIDGGNFELNIFDSAFPEFVDIILFIIILI